MSTLISAACWGLDVPPTPKFVLVCLADNANDAGYCWPSINTICERTGYGRTAVMDAIAWLESHGALTAHRENGRHTTYTVTPRSYQSASRTGPPAEPVRLTDRSASRTGQAIPTVAGQNQSASRTGAPSGPVRETDSNQEQELQKKKEKKPSASAAPTPVLELPDWLPADAWADWCAYRKAKAKAAWTHRAQVLSIAKLEEFRSRGHSPRTVIDLAIVSGWQGLYEPKPQPGASNHANRTQRGNLSAVDRVREAIAERQRERGEFDDGDAINGTCERVNDRALLVENGGNVRA